MQLPYHDLFLYVHLCTCAFISIESYLKISIKHCTTVIQGLTYAIKIQSNSIKNVPSQNLSFSLLGRFMFSDKPIMVAKYSFSGSSTSQEERGDPSMVMVTPISAYQSR